MFAQLASDFNDRVGEVDLYFQVLLALDNDEIIVGPGTSGQVVPIGAAPTDWHSMLKGAAYLVLYNLVEAFIRRGFQAVFESIKSDRLSCVELTELLRSQWITQKNRKVQAFDGSPKVYMQIAGDIVDEIICKKVAQLHADQLPITGNLDADAIREVCIRHGVDYKTSPPAKGGYGLTIVKQKRNSLSHGDESFTEVGRVASASQLNRVKDELVLFTREILTNLEKFVANKEYRAFSYTG